RPPGRGALRLPPAAGTAGMFLLLLRVPPEGRCPHPPLAGARSAATGPGQPRVASGAGAPPGAGAHRPAVSSKPARSRAIRSTAPKGSLPIAVSPVSTSPDTPSRRRLATSLASATVAVTLEVPPDRPVAT